MSHESGWLPLLNFVRIVQGIAPYRQIYTQNSMISEAISIQSYTNKGAIWQSKADTVCFLMLTFNRGIGLHPKCVFI